MRYRADTDATRRIASTAVLLAVAAVIGYLESVVVPPLPVPGLRLGLANVVVVFTLATLGARAAAFVSIGRVFVIGLAAATLGGPSFALSLAGALASLLVMTALAAAGDRFSVIGWSIAGSAAHVSAQLVVASALIGSSAPLALAPLALAASIPLGLAVGYTTRLLISRIPDLALSAAGR